jgi:hypothetical protein
MCGRIHAASEPEIAVIVMANGWLLLAGGIFWTLNSLGAGVCLGHWLARQRQPTPSPDGATAPDGRADEHDRWSPLAGEVARGVAQAGAAVRKAEWLSAVCEETAPKPPATIRTAVRELTGAVRNLHVQIGSIFAAFQSLRDVQPDNEDSSPLAGIPHEIRAGIELIGRRRRLGGFEPPPPRSRFPYHCRQWVAPCPGGRLPSAREFFPVQCRHLDGDGVAFYVDNVLPAEKFVISLGSGDSLIFMLARVISEHSQPAGAPGRYMLACRLLQRIDAGVYMWNAAKGAVDQGELSAASPALAASER